MQGRVSPPWKPSVVGSLDTSQFDQEFTSMQPIGKDNFTLNVGLFLA